MRTIKFTLKEKSRANNFYIFVMFAGGDADTEHPQEFLMPFPFSEYEKHLGEIKTQIEFYQNLKTVLESEMKYDEILEEYNKEMANAYDNVPNDPQNDYQDKCYLDSITLVGYDMQGNKFESYV
jgi:hypothetical protein